MVITEEGKVLILVETPIFLRTKIVRKPHLFDAIRFWNKNLTFERLGIMEMGHSPYFKSWIKRSQLQNLRLISVSSINWYSWLHLPVVKELSAKNRRYLLSQIAALTKNPTTLHICMNWRLKESYKINYLIKLSALIRRSVHNGEHIPLPILLETHILPPLLLTTINQYNWLSIPLNVYPGGHWSCDLWIGWSARSPHCYRLTLLIYIIVCNHFFTSLFCSTHQI